MRETNDPGASGLGLQAAVLAILLMLLVLAGMKAYGFYLLSLYRDGVSLVDFDIFHIVGQMAWLGTFDEAYSFQLFVPYQSELGGGESMMPWTYPPMFGLVTAALGSLPIWLAYALFILATLGAYLLVLRSLARENFPLVLCALLPFFGVTIICGQNGFLTGTLVGLFTMLALRRSGAAGVPLGFMAIKPHLALGLGLYLLLSRRWGWVGQAVAVALGTAVLATLVFGLGVWPAFLHGVEESKGFLAAGLYPLDRMTSVYAALRSFGLEAQVALGLHLGVALCGVAMLYVAVAQRWRAERLLAIAAMTSLTLSPYNYDYDMGIFGVALALAMKDLVTTGRLFLGVFGLAWFACGYGILASIICNNLGIDRSVPELRPYSLAGLAYVLLVALVFARLWKAERVGSSPRQRADAVSSGQLAGR